MIRLACALRDLCGLNRDMVDFARMRSLFVGVCCTNCVEWYVFDLACVYACGLVNVGLHTMWGATERLYVIRHAELQGMIHQRRWIRCHSHMDLYSFFCGRDGVWQVFSAAAKNWTS